MQVSPINSSPLKPSFLGNSNNNQTKIKTASLAGSIIGVATAVGGIMLAAKKGGNPMKLSNLSFAEKDAFIMGAGSIIGGLAGGILADNKKENIKPKLREANQQFFGSLAIPIGLLAMNKNLLAKSKFKMPLLKNPSPISTKINSLLKVLPDIGVTIGSLVVGMETGNLLVNKLNNTIFKEKVKHEVKASDYAVHGDDICLAASMLSKGSTVSNVASKCLPLAYVLSGYKTGIQQKEQ